MALPARSHLLTARGEHLRLRLRVARFFVFLFLFFRKLLGELYGLVVNCGSHWEPPLIRINNPYIELSKLCMEMKNRNRGPLVAGGSLRSQFLDHFGRS